MVRDRESHISSKVSPISSVWSSRTFVITPISERTIFLCEISWRNGSTAIHSITRTWACSLTAIRITRACSRIFAFPRRRSGRSTPSVPISRGTVPVVLQKTDQPPDFNPAAIIRVTVDFPRIPFTYTTCCSKALSRLT